MREPAKFWSKVDTSGDCWLWTASTKDSGYGAFWNGHKVVGAHIYSYVLFYGPVPDGHVVMHDCDRPACVNPAHLTAGTQAQNLRQMAERGRAHNGQRDKTECPSGHTYDDANTWTDKRGFRYCRACARERAARRRASKTPAATRVGQQ